MDTTATEFKATEAGCNFCEGAKSALIEVACETRKLEKTIVEIKKDGKGKDYDVIIGLSGGADSATVLHRIMKFGLRPLCFTVDNGWNDPRADENILRMVETLKVPFYRYTIDTKKFHELQFAFMKMGLINAEIPTDHILMATSFEMASKYGVKWILSGGNVATESIMPASWSYNARDLVHIKDVYRQATNKKLTGLPVCSLLKWNYYRWIKGIKIFYPLDYMDYDRKLAISELASEYGYQDYGAKHEESFFTRWFQNFYLYEKYGIDKRKAHLSSMIMSGQMTRGEALCNLSGTLEYPELGLECLVMKFPKREHSGFKHDNYDLMAKIVKACKF